MTITRRKTTKSRRFVPLTPGQERSLELRELEQEKRRIIARSALLKREHAAVIRELDRDLRAVESRIRRLRSR
jgi:hypothetical protein